MSAPLQLNLILGWLWILAGFATGLALGLFFHREDWLGGYASWKRRMFRLTHVSFFALGAVNLLFGLTIRNFAAPGAPSGLASWGFALGAVTMPFCCALMAFVPKARLLFAIPVVSLLTAAVHTVMLLGTNLSTPHIP